MSTVSPIVYIADDNPYDIDLVKLAFEENGIAATFMSAPNGEDAASYIRALAADPTLQRPHLMLLDLNMPKMKGTEVLAIIRSLATLKRMPVVVLTTSESPVDWSRCLALGADRVIHKAHRLEDFIAAMQPLRVYFSDSDSSGNPPPQSDPAAPDSAPATERSPRSSRMSLIPELFGWLNRPQLIALP